MTVKLDRLFSETNTQNVKELTYISNPKTDVESWTNLLAHQELGEAAKQVFVTLLELRGLECDDVLRFKIIQKIEPDLLHLLLSLEQHYLNNSLLDTKRDQQIADLVLEIKGHHALLYVDIFQRTHQTLETRKFSILEFSLKKKLTLLRKHTAILALKQLTELLYSSQLLYLDAPKRFWHYAYLIYRTACLSEFVSEKLDKISEHHDSIDTVEKAFTKLVLLNLLNSHKLRQTEIKELMQCVEYWIQLVHFTTAPDTHSKYVFNYFSDQAPKSYVHTENPHKESFYIDTSELSTYIESTLKPNARYYSKVEERSLTNVLKHHIQTILNQNPMRNSIRYSDEGVIDVTLGITSAHFFLSHARHFKETLALESDLNLQNNNQILASISGDKEIQLSTKTYEQRFNAEITRIYETHIVNRSDSGFCLKWQTHPPKHLRTGEFILVRENKNEPWTGAIIRWMKNNHEQSIDFGVECLSSRMSPLAVCIPKQGANPIYHPAILVLDNNQQYSLILPSAQVFYENQNLLLRFGSTELKIFLKQGITLTQSCARFSFDLLEQSRLSLLNQYFEQHLDTLKTQDLWESLK